MRQLIAACSVMLLLGLGSLAASADTVYLTDGSTLDGVVSQPNENCFVVASGSGSLMFEASRIQRVEKNDKKGSIDLGKVNPWAVKYEEDMTKRTGLTATQREEVVLIIDKFASEDANERQAAIKKLAAMQKQLPIFTFLVATIDSYGARTLPGVLEVLMAIDRGKAIPIVRDCATNPVARNRAAALQIMGAARDVASVDTIARGLVDEDESVRVAAAGALAVANNRRATPALIENLGNLDKRVVNACNAALSKLWSEENAEVKFVTAEEWNTFWEGRSSTVSEPISTSKLEPLFVTEPGSYVIAHE
ncbi:MAG: hypothetical protein IT365_07940 [Candidatus Hydrogenedentes bacterium]|nr:hypothetical protein [Candidatus Hydrogenedentota bacterium]